MKSGPTSAVTSARMSAIATPSRVVCTPSPPKVRPKSFAPGGVRRPRKKPGHQRVEHNLCSRIMTATGRARDPATLRPQRGGNIGRVDGKSMSAANNLARNSSEPDGLVGARSDRHDFPRIHDVVRIERALDGGHGRQRRASKLAREVFHLALPDAMLTGARAIHGQRPLDQLLA